MAVIESAEVHGVLLKFPKVDVARGHDASPLVIAFLPGCLQSELLDAELVIKLDCKHLREDGDVVVNLDLSFAAWAVQVAKSDALGAVLVLQGHEEAVRMEHVSTR